MRTEDHRLFQPCPQSFVHAGFGWLCGYAESVCLKFSRHSYNGEVPQLLPLIFAGPQPTTDPRLLFLLPLRAAEMPPKDGGQQAATRRGSAVGAPRAPGQVKDKDQR